jgi:hypothetical protein
VLNKLPNKLVSPPISCDAQAGKFGLPADVSAYVSAVARANWQISKALVEALAKA